MRSDRKWVAATLGPKRGRHESVMCTDICPTCRGVAKLARCARTRSHLGAHAHYDDRLPWNVPPHNWS